MNIFHEDKSVSKKTPNSFRLFVRPSTKSFPTSTNDNSSRISFWVFKTAKELNRFCVIVNRSQVFILRVIDNERSTVADMESFFNTSQITVIKLHVRRWCCGVDCKSLTVSSKLQGKFSSEIVRSKSSSDEMTNESKPPETFPRFVLIHLHSSLSKWLSETVAQHLRRYNILAVQLIFYGVNDVV